MTTDNNTLADVQPSFTTGHCQHNNRLGGCQLHNMQCGWPNCDRKAVEPSLADVQPGGRVRLGDQAERARFEAWASAEGLNAHIHSANGMYSHPVARGAWLAWQHLSAQPSPGEHKFHHVSEVAKHFGMAVTPEEMGEAIASAPSSRFSVEAAAAAFANVKPSPGETLPPEMRLGSPDYLDYLDAKPSPGGQGEVLLEQVARFLDYSVGHDPWPNIRRAYGDAWWEPVRKMRDDLRALAASQPVETQLGYTLSDVHEAYSRGKRDAERQPVGNYEIQTENGPLKCSLAVYAEWQKNEEYIARLEEELKSARQPVGVPDFFMVRDEDESRWRESDEATFDSVKRQRPDDAIALYAAPPAQAVDLGQFRDLAEFALSNAKLHNCWEKREALARELLALIDGKAVGK